jgi:hypothetical protein
MAVLRALPPAVQKCRGGARPAGACTTQGARASCLSDTGFLLSMRPLSSAAT